MTNRFKYWLFLVLGLIWLGLYAWMGYLELLVISNLWIAASMTTHD